MGASNPWSLGTKRMVVAVGLILCALLIYIAWPIVPVVGAAAVLAYLLLPLVERLCARGVKRGLAVGSVYIALLVVVFVVLALIIPASINSLRSIEFPGVVSSFATRLSAALETYRVITLGGARVDLSAIVDPLQQRLHGTGADVLPDLSSVLSLVTGVASSAIGSLFGFLGTLVLVLITAFYITLDLPLIGRAFWLVTPERSHTEMRLLSVQLNAVWGAFFRGQLFLGFVIGVATTIGGLIIGLPGALWLGLIAGILEVVPSVGPVLSAIPALLIAFVQGSTWMPVEPLLFAVIVLLMYIIIQQLENNLLVPRIIGDAVGLPPVVVLLGAIVGAIVAGLLGVFLAAPVIASVVLLVRYTVDKLHDRVPFERGAAGGPPAAKEPRK